MPPSPGGGAHAANRDALGEDLVDAAAVEIDDLELPAEGFKHLPLLRQLAKLVEPMGAETLMHVRSGTLDIRVVVPREIRVKPGHVVHHGARAREVPSAAPPWSGVVGGASGHDRCFLAIVTAAAFGLARIRMWQWLAITTIVFAALSNAVALLARDQNALIGISQLLSLPLAFLSSAIMDPRLAPSWLQTVATYNPLDWAVVVSREALSVAPDWTACAGVVGARYVTR